MASSMKSSPVYPAHENGSSSAYDEFDPRADFAQFLEEAKIHTINDEVKATPLQCNWPQTRQQIEPEKKQKKTWKSSLFSWWKTTKKNKHAEESSNLPRMPKPKRGYVSGPIQRNLAEAIVSRPRKTASGPLGGLFNSTKRVDNEMSYICLDRLNNPHDLHSYGPVYLVT